jgi:hypothetical protein
VTSAHAGIESVSDALHTRARAFVTAFEARAPMPESFDALACDLARFQAAHVDGFARLCRARGVDVGRALRAHDVPAVPTDAFKLTRVAAFAEAEATITFRTSGTTIGARGTHAMRTSATYDAGALAFGRWALARDFRAAPVVLVVGPSPDEAKDSSLTHMIALFVRMLGASVTASDTYFLRGDELREDALRARILDLDPMVPALVLGTSFAFVHLIDAARARGPHHAALALPKGSRIMQTGGFKGRSREVDAETLRRELSELFVVEPRAIVSEYGMTELSSQFYDAQPSPGVFVEPPWARVVPVDPETLAPVSAGEIGIARVEDLLNVDSAFAVLASDRVRRVEGGFELLGRAKGAAPRGCSISIDEILGG